MNFLPRGVWRAGWRQVMLPALVIFTALILVGVTASTSDITVSNQPASEGRRVTPAGSLLVDVTTRQPAVGALPVKFVRSPDNGGPDGRGRYLLAVNSGFGVHFNSATNRAQQSLIVIDLNFKPAPSCVQNVYFPSPQSINVGVAFAAAPDTDGSYALYVSGGFENKIWVFRFDPRAGRRPISPVPSGFNATIDAPFIDVSGFSDVAASPDYNNNRVPVYPTGIALSPDGDTLYTANNLGDSLGIIRNVRGERQLTRVDLRRENREHLIYPYEVLALPDAANKGTAKVYVSCWNDATVAVIDPRKTEGVAARIAVARHPTAMIFNGEGTRLYVVNSNADSVSVIDTSSDREIERINVRLAEKDLIGASPEGLALSADNRTLYVANAHSNSVAVVSLSEPARGGGGEASRKATGENTRSIVRGFVPTGQYPSAVAVIGGLIYIGNGKGTGVQNSSLVVDNSGRAPNVANDRFPAGTGRGVGAGGQYSVSLIVGNISVVPVPDERALANYTQQVMRNNSLLGTARTKLFKGESPIKHVIYVIKENRTYDQVFGDVPRAGNGQAADGDATLAIFGAGEAARRENGPPQNITPNQRALALRFGLLDRFFVNSEASPDGHNWSTAAFSNDYVDKAYRWNYSGRGRTYDFEGFNRLPNSRAVSSAGGLVDADDVINFMRRYVPYLNNSRDVAEPETLYLWDAAARKGLSYRNYGEFVGTVSEADVTAINTRRRKSYPDISPTVKTLPTKKSLEGHHSLTFRNYDLSTPDAMTVESYRAAKTNGVSAFDPLIAPDHAEIRFRGTSRLIEWLKDFREYAADLQAGQPDRMPQFMMVRLPNNHTSGLQPGMPTPQFAVADNDYAVGRLVEAVSNSPYWKNTAIFILEDDAQDGPDHVDAHRSPALVISAYNRPGALVHDFHNTVSLIRTMEILLGLEPMNQLDATAAPIDIFREQADLTPYKSLLPEVALDNLLNPAAGNAQDQEALYWIKRTAEQDLAHADMADPRVLNEIIWFSVRGSRQPIPAIARLPLFDAMRSGIIEDDEEEEEREENQANIRRNRLAE